MSLYRYVCKVGTIALQNRAEWPGSARPAAGRAACTVAFLRLANPRAIAGLQSYASNWNSVQTYASKPQRLGAYRPAQIGANARFTANLCFQPCKPMGEVTIHSDIDRQGKPPGAGSIKRYPTWPERANRSMGHCPRRGAHSDGRSPRYWRQELGSGALNRYRQFGPAERHSAFLSQP